MQPIHASGPAVLVLCGFLGACTNSYSMMPVNELVRADCQQLAQEYQNTRANAEAYSEGSTIGLIGSLGLMALETMTIAAGGQSDYSASTMGIEGSAQDSETARQLEERARLIGQLQAKKGC
jgi:hypothetical protein